MFSKIIIRLREAVYYQRVLIFKLSTDHLVGQPLCPEFIQILNATLEDVRKLHSDPDMDLKDYTWNFLREKIANNLWHCLFAKMDNRAIGYTFYTIHEMTFRGAKKVEFALPQGAAYLFRTFVHPMGRNKGIGKMLGTARLRVVKDKGSIEAYVAVNSTNEVSIHNSKKLGGRVIGSMVFVKTRFFNKAYRSPLLLSSGLKLKPDLSR